MKEAIVIALTQGTALTLIGLVFTYLAIKVSPKRALGIYGVGMVVKLVVGIGMISLTALGMGEKSMMIPYMLTIGGVVAISSPCTAIALTTTMRGSNYTRMEDRR